MCLGKVIVILSLIGLFLLASSPEITPSVDPVSPPCPTDQISFAQAEGCLNDGSIEFCIPADDPEVLAQVQAIVPGIECLPYGGRARCNRETQRLCMLSTDGMCITQGPDDSSYAMSDQGWATVCALAALPAVKQIVPTWYE
jgi:hypothetical protein